MSRRAVVVGLILVVFWQFMARVGADPWGMAAGESQHRALHVLQLAHEHVGASTLVGQGIEAVSHLAADDSTQAYGLLGALAAIDGRACRSECDRVPARSAGSPPPDRLFRPPRLTA